MAGRQGQARTRKLYVGDLQRLRACGRCWGAREILSKIRATTNKPIRFVLNTHYHGDHAYGNEILVDAGAVIVSSEATDKEARTRGADGWTKWNDQAHSLNDTRQEFASLTMASSLRLYRVSEIS
jgi:glyoxylase-like metal-dependent hydrolase (beta-lactamase superfamily II)